MGEVGERQWWDGKLVFTTDVQHGTTDHQDFELGAADQQVRKPRCRCRYLPEIVEQQQQVLVSYMGLQQIRYWLLSGFLDPEHLGNGWIDQIRIA